MASSQADFCWSLHWLGLNSALDFLKEHVKLTAVGVCYNNRAKVKRSNSKNIGGQCEGDLGMEKGGKREGEKGEARDTNNCDSCVDVESWAITGRFQDRNAEQISQTAARAHVRHGRQGRGTKYNSCLIPNFCLCTSNPGLKAQPGFWKTLTSYSLCIYTCFFQSTSVTCLDWNWHNTCQPQAQVIS